MNVLRCATNVSNSDHREPPNFTDKFCIQNFSDKFMRLKTNIWNYWLFVYKVASDLVASKKSTTTTTYYNFEVRQKLVKNLDSVKMSFMYFETFLWTEFYTYWSIECKEAYYMIKYFRIMYLLLVKFWLKNIL